MGVDEVVVAWLLFKEYFLRQCTGILDATVFVGGVVFNDEGRGEVPGGPRSLKFDFE